MDEARTQPKRESTDERRQAIAMAARELIIEKGFEGLRTRDIAERVGINIATLHYHVPSKEALIELVAQTIHDEFSVQSGRRSRDGLSALQQLEMEFEDFRETLTRMPGLVIVFSEMLDRSRREKRVDQFIAPLHAFWNEQFETIFALGVADGSMRADLDAEAMARIFTGALGDFWRRSPENLDLYDRLAAQLMRAVVIPVSPKD